jgi:hypothetical protein
MNSENKMKWKKVRKDECLLNSGLFGPSLNATKSTSFTDPDYLTSFEEAPKKARALYMFSTAHAHLIHISDGEWHIDRRRNHPNWIQVRCNKYMHKWQERGWWCRGMIKWYFHHAEMSGHIDIESDIDMLCDTQLLAKPWAISGFFL